MKTNKLLTISKFTVMALDAIFIICFLPFYIGYGNVIPFTNPSYAIWDNLWLIIFPIMLLSLAISIIFPRIGGLVVVIPILSLISIESAFTQDAPYIMFVPVVLGFINIAYGYYKNVKEQNDGTRSNNEIQ